MERRSIRKRIAYTAAACAFVLVLAALAPRIITIGWHLTHSNKEKYSGYEVLVPADLFLIRTGNGVQLIHMRTVLSGRLYNFAKIEIQKQPGQSEIREWEKAAVNATVKAGFKNVRAFDVSVAGAPAACVQRTQGEGSDVARVAYCKSADGLVVQFFGDEDDLSRLREVAGGPGAGTLS
jgi:hypothetical protein